MKLGKAFRQILIVVGASLSLAINAFAQASNEPDVRGGYYLCPNGLGLPVEFWSKNYGNTAQMAHKDTWKQIKNIEGKLIVDWSLPRNRSDDARQQAKRLMEGKVPTDSYALKRTKANWHVRHWDDIHKVRNSILYIIHTYEFVNSQGRKIRLSPGRFESVVEDNNGVLVDASVKLSMSSLKCSGDFIVVRLVDQLEPDSMRNKYGEKLPSPTMFLIRELSFKAHTFPSRALEYSF